MQVSVSDNHSNITKYPVACDIWYMTYDIWYMTYDIWYMTYHIWYMTYHIWYITYDTALHVAEEADAV